MPQAGYNRFNAVRENVHGDSRAEWRQYSSPPCRGLATRPQHMHEPQSHTPPCESAQTHGARNFEQSPAQINPYSSNRGTPRTASRRSPSGTQKNSRGTPFGGTPREVTRFVGEMPCGSLTERSQREPGHSGGRRRSKNVRAGVLEGVAGASAREMKEYMGRSSKYGGSGDLMGEANLYVGMTPDGELLGGGGRRVEGHVTPRGWVTASSGSSLPSRSASDSGDITGRSCIPRHQSNSLIGR